MAPGLWPVRLVSFGAFGAWLLLTALAYQQIGLFEHAWAANLLQYLFDQLREVGRLRVNAIHSRCPAREDRCNDEDQGKPIERMTKLGHRRSPLCFAERPLEEKGNPRHPLHPNVFSDVSL